MIKSASAQPALVDKAAPVGKAGLAAKAAPVDGAPAQAITLHSSLPVMAAMAAMPATVALVALAAQVARVDRSR